VSIIVEEDLPIYYWVHRMSQVHKIATYQWLLRNAKRFLLDSAVSTPEARTSLAAPDGFRDLAEARLLPVRQAIGQFLSAYGPRVIVRDLRTVIVAGAPAFTPSPGCCLIGCGRASKSVERRQVADRPMRSREPRRVRPRHWNWRLPTTMVAVSSGARSLDRGASYFESTIGGGRQTLPMTTACSAPRRPSARRSSISHAVGRSLATDDRPPLDMLWALGSSNGQAGFLHPHTNRFASARGELPAIA